VAPRRTAPPSSPRRRRRRGWLGAAIALAVSLAVAYAYQRFGETSVATAIEGQTLTWRFLLRGALQPPGDVAIIAIDDKAVAQAGRFPVPRQLLADAVARLRAAGAAVIGIDLLLLEPDGPSDGRTASPDDRALREALQAGPPAVLAAAFIARPGIPLDEPERAALAASAYHAVQRSPDAPPGAIPHYASAEVPIAPLLTTGAGLGHTNLPTQEGSMQRFLPLAVGYDDLTIPALPVEVARRFLGLGPDRMILELGHGLQLGDRWVHSDRLTQVPLDYYGPAGTIPTWSLADLLAGSVDPARLRGKAMMIGATALGVGDLFITPFSPALPGVEVMATAVDNLLHGTALDRSTRVVALDLAAILAFGLLAFAAAWLLPPALSGVAAAGCLIAWAIVTELGFAAAGLWLDLTFPAAAILLNAGIAAAWRAAEERRLRHDSDRQRRNLSRYQAPALAPLLAEQDEAELAAREQQATLLFVDMAGFTGRSERMSPAETARLLRDFHRRIETAMLAHGGVLLSFTGDGAMVIFGVPSPGPQDAAAALAAARALVDDVARWNEALDRQGTPPLAIRIGIHCGPVMIAALGGEAQRQLTAAGDTVNVASRLESLSRGTRAPISISDAVHQAVRDAGRPELLQGFRRLPPQPLRGRLGVVTVWVGGGAALRALRAL
jgi:adenylate cyclase